MPPTVSSSGTPSDSMCRILRDLPTDLFVQGGQPLCLPGRHANHPVLFRVDSHPLATEYVKNIFVYVQDTSRQALQRSYEWEETLVVPLGKDEEMQGLGDHESLNPPTVC